MTDELKRLQRWYFARCNGDWEHTYGVKIENIDNPGWMLAVDLENTYLENVPFESVKIQQTDEDNWVHCQKEKKKIRGACGPHNLLELLSIFLDWAEKHEPSRQIG